MYEGRSAALVIAAGGTGSRMGSDIPKQYLKIGGITILRRTVQVFKDMDIFDQIIIAAAAEYMDYCREILEGTGAIVTEGGATRMESVYKGVCKADTDYILVHDAARPFVTEKVILGVLEGAIRDGACICAVQPKDTIRTQEKTLDRSSLYSVQTPQGFETKELKAAYEKAFSEGFSGTDDASVIEYAGGRVSISEGDYGNIKITTREDLPMETRIGTGYDVHKLVEGRDCILGGVTIPYEKGLLGHSDADVLVHAIMDALLGAAGMGDIGRLFPDTDDEFKGISSIELLNRVYGRLHEEGYQVGNVDAIVIAQRPKISPYVEEMRANIAASLHTDVSNVNIKGTTTEKLGFEGRGEGISSQAVCILQR